MLVKQVIKLCNHAQNKIMTATALKYNRKKKL